MADSCRRRGVADPHFAKTEHIATRFGSLSGGTQARAKGSDKGRLVQRWGLGKVCGRVVKVQGNHRQHDPIGAAELVNRRPIGLEVGHHLHRHFGRIGRNALRRDTMVSGKDNTVRSLDRAGMLTLPGGEPGGELFQAAQRTGGFGQHRLAGERFGAGGLIGGGQVGNQRGDRRLRQNFRAERGLAVHACTFGLGEKG
jgi:hypothetical protein